MQLNAYAIHDVKAGIYSRPFFCVNDAVARRNFRSLVNDGESDVGRSPSDYTLFSVGYYDDSTGHLEAVGPISLGNGVEFVSVGNNVADKPELKEVKHG